MNKKKHYELSDADSLLLSIIQYQFELAETICGPEPEIYRNFDIPVFREPADFEILVKHRIESYNRRVLAKSNN